MHVLNEHLNKINKFANLDTKRKKKQKKRKKKNGKKEQNMAT